MSPQFSVHTGGATMKADPAMDAEHLMKAHEVTKDPKRHAAAIKHLQDKVAGHKDVIDNNVDTIKSKVKKGLNEAFGVEDKASNAADGDEENKLPTGKKTVKKTVGNKGDQAVGKGTNEQEP